MTTTLEKVGRFRIEELIGEGGMGEVYRARDEELDHTVVLKRLLPEAAADDSLRKRFYREAKTVSRLGHPAIVPIHEIFEDERGHWIVMEFVPGESLADVIEREGPQPPARVRDLARQIAEGLAEAHDKGVVHRDLKTENVIVTPEGKARIIDFGLAKPVYPDSSDSTLTVMGSMIGTCRTMSPEQALAEEVDHRADLHALGVLMYEALAGISPFAAATTVETLAAIIGKRHPPIREKRPEVPEPLAELVDRLLAKQPDDRPQTAREVIELLDALPAEARRGKNIAGAFKSFISRARRGGS